MKRIFEDADSFYGILIIILNKLSTFSCYVLNKFKNASILKRIIYIIFIIWFVYGLLSFIYDLSSIYSLGRKYYCLKTEKYCKYDYVDISNFNFKANYSLIPYSDKEIQKPFRYLFESDREKLIDAQLTLSRDSQSIYNFFSSDQVEAIHTNFFLRINWNCKSEDSNFICDDQVLNKTLAILKLMDNYSMPLYHGYVYADVISENAKRELKSISFRSVILCEHQVRETDCENYYGDFPSIEYLEILSINCFENGKKIFNVYESCELD